MTDGKPCTHVVRLKFGESIVDVPNPAPPPPLTSPDSVSFPIFRVSCSHYVTFLLQFCLIYTVHWLAGTQSSSRVDGGKFSRVNINLKHSEL